MKWADQERFSFPGSINLSMLEPSLAMGAFPRRKVLSAVDLQAKSFGPGGALATAGQFDRGIEGLTCH